MDSKATYDQCTGAFIIWSPVDDGGIERVQYEATGYAGKGRGRNEPDLEYLHRIGPLPKGKYAVRGPADHPRLGRFVFRLDRIDDGPTFGRGGFYIHGDSRSDPGEASEGCIVLDRDARDAVAYYGVREVWVFASRLRGKSYPTRIEEPQG